MPSCPVSAYCDENVYTEYASPRFSRISWKRREDAEPPSTPSRIEAVKRRRSDRAIPGAARQTWYCYVSRSRKTSEGGGGATRGVRGDPLRAGGSDAFCTIRSTSPTSSP